jgi:hypothetical protein
MICATPVHVVPVDQNKTKSLFRMNLPDHEVFTNATLLFQRPMEKIYCHLKYFGGSILILKIEPLTKISEIFNCTIINNGFKVSVKTTTKTVAKVTPTNTVSNVYTIKNPICYLL